MGYLPRDVGGQDPGAPGHHAGQSRRAGTSFSETGELLTWFGRDPDYEEKHRKWEASDKSDREPEKFHFVKGFHKGLELYGQHALRDECTSEKLKGLGLIVVEGPNDVIRLDTLGVPVVGLCGNTISEDQADKAAALAREVGGGVVTLMLDLDDEGRKGLMQCLEHLAQRIPVRVAWSTKMYGGKFKGRQPERVSEDDWSIIWTFLARHGDT